jgi:hypothetical protein
LKTSRNTDKESIFQAGSNIDYLSGELSGSPREFAIEAQICLTTCRRE